jgi:hypothetical protein
MPIEPEVCPSAGSARASAARLAETQRRRHRLTTPTAYSRVPSDLLSFPLAERRRPGLSALPAERYGGRVLPLILRGWHLILDLAGRDLGDHDGAGVYVGGASFALGASGHYFTRLSWS